MGLERHDCEEAGDFNELAVEVPVLVLEDVIVVSVLSLSRQLGQCGQRLDAFLMLVEIHF